MLQENSEAFASFLSGACHMKSLGEDAGPVDSEALDDDFDFGGGDTAATKLDLARAYIDMGDSDGARDILSEVMTEGSDDQQREANELLEQLS